MNERMLACCIEQALAVGIPAGRRPERKKAWSVPAVTPNRKFRLHDDVQAVAQGMELPDTWHVIHKPEGVAVGVKLPAVQSRPRGYTGAHEPTLEPRVAPGALGRVDRRVGAIARIEPQQMVDDGRLVLLNCMPQRHVDRHAARLDQRDGLGSIIRPMQDQRDMGRSLEAVPAQLPAQQLRCHANVFLAVG
jgi:hypothetical protein